MNRHKLTVTEDQAGQRLDRFVADLFPDISRAQVGKLIEQGLITINQFPVKPATRVKPENVIQITIPEPTLLEVLPEAIPLSVLYEDDSLIAINKPAGMVIHPSAGHPAGTLVNALLAHCGDSLSGIGGVMRPGIVHRLDKETSGVILVAKNDEAHISLSRQLKERTITKTYVAVVKGLPKNGKGTITTQIGRSRSDRKKMTVTKSGGRGAVTEYRVTSTLEKVSVVEITLVTGRTHQIRVHMKHINCPVVGDPVYSRGIGKFPIKRQALHAWRISFDHPVSGKSVTLTAPLPDDMARLISSVGGDPAPYL